jgi:nitrate/TMAO reductase-like tetraheme cytochrome c subunit
MTGTEPESSPLPADASPPAAGAPKAKRRNRKKLLRLGLIAGAALIIVLFAAVEMTSTSSFCSSCHYMKSFYQSWKTSSHGRIECKVCHYPPGIRNTIRAKLEGLVMVGRYWTKLYLKSKPWAEIQDESCLQKGCHDRRLLEGQVKFKSVVFDHKAHFADLKRGKQLRCTSCHSQIVQGEHITVTEASCFLCHFKKTEDSARVSACVNCHKRETLTAPQARYNHTVVFDGGFKCDKCHSQVIVGDGAVPKENCFKCHFEKDRLDRYNETAILHNTHITKNKIECTQCHLAIQHKINKDLESIADCRTCHTGSHQAQKILFTGTGGRGVDHPMPNVMLEKGLSCKGCHMFHEETGGAQVKSQTAVSREQACESCHGKGFGDILKNWEISTGRKLKAINAIYQAAAGEILQAVPARRAAAEKLLQDAAFNIDVVERGKSVHNIEYSQELLRAAFQTIAAALKTIGSSTRPDGSSFKPAVKTNACLNCHSGIEEISIPVFGLKFPHKNHVATLNLDCAACHSNAKKHGELTATKTSCAACHHKDVKKDCSACHTTQSLIYKGGPFGTTTVTRDVMAEAETACTACHLDKSRRIVRPDAAPCVECHEKGFDKTFADWQATTRSLQAEVRAAINGAARAGLGEEQKAQRAEIELILKTIEQDGSSGIHNHAFAAAALKDALKKIQSWTKG